MRPSVKVFTLASVALLSCRGILGIEEIEEGTADGGAGTPDAATDSVGTDSAKPDVAPGEDAGACANKTGNDCGKCCRDSNQIGNGELEANLKQCLCDAGSGCSPADSCFTTKICGGTAEPKDTPCIPCIDSTVKSNLCPSGKMQCGASANCKAVFDCIAACK